MLEHALSAARSGRDQALADLCEELRMPSVSTLPEHRDDCRRNARWLVDRLAGLGFDAREVDAVEDGHPVVRADWIARPGAAVLTIYGHYDVQPPDPLDEWHSDPFDPVIAGGFVVARGCADNKGNHLAALKAAEYWMAAGGPPVNLRFLIEGEEEIGGDSLPGYLSSASDELRTDHVLLWDGGFSADEHPSLCVGLRGLLYTEIEVSGASHDLHSGAFGGVAPNAAAELARILAALHDEQGRVTIPGFYDDVRDPDPSELKRWHRDPRIEERLKAMIGASELTGEAGFDVDERLWSRPTLEVNGIVGGFTGHGAKTVIPARASAKVSMRLVPDQDPAAILKSMRAYVEGLAGPGVSVRVVSHTSSPPMLLGSDHSGARAAAAAWEQAMRRPAVIVRSGGSIPVATTFHDALGAPMVISGVASKDSGAHAPNERLRLDNFYGGIEMLVRYMQEIADAHA